MNPSRRIPAARAAICLLALGLAAASLEAAEYRSSMGFRAEVPDSWVILTREEVAENPDLFENVSLPGADPSALETMRKRITGGQVDFLFKVRESRDEFADNINVMKQIASLPTSEAELLELCPQLSPALSAAFGREIAMHACQRRSVGGRTALYVVFEGAVPGSRSAQYQIARSESVALVVTATAREERAASVFAELDAIVETIEFD